MLVILHCCDLEYLEVGKSCICEKFIWDRFIDFHDKTIGVDFGVQTLKIDEKIVKTNDPAFLKEILSDVLFDFYLINESPGILNYS